MAVIKVRSELIGRSYVEIFKIAQNANDTANTLRNDHNLKMRVALDISQLDKISVDYSMAAFEAYLNYLFERLIGSPSISNSKTPEFWLQYKEVRRVLVNLF